MEFRPLQPDDLDALVSTFNRAFADYFIIIQFTRQTLSEKMLNDRTDWSHSVGAFDGGQLVGFMLHGVGERDGKRTVYNGGTGVVPEHRGKGLTRQMYACMLPVLKEKGIEQCVLEVFAQNTPAIRSYESVGFKVLRTLPCFRGEIEETLRDVQLEFEVMEQWDWGQLKSFWDWRPTWQNDAVAVEQSRGTNEVIGVKAQGELVGYAAVNATSGRVQQFAIHPRHRRKGYGTHLFRHVYDTVGHKISTINVDGDAEGTIAFLTTIGLHEYFVQYEMLLELPGDR